MVTWQPPFCRSSWASIYPLVLETNLLLLHSPKHNGALTSPVGPAPNIRTCEPNLGRILSRPWQAHEAGSSKVASTQFKFLNLKTFAAG